LDLRLGADPELPLVNKTGQIVPAEEVSAAIRRSQKVKKDGINVEINPSAASCREHLLSYIGSSIMSVQRICQSEGLDVSRASTYEVPRKVLDALPAADRQFGCEEDKDAYSGKVRVVKADPKQLDRYAGGHMHFGSPSLTRLTDKQIHEVVQLLDIGVGNIGVLFEQDQEDSNKRRREVYGSAGAYRRPAHGLEYRVPSNWWVWHPATTSMIFLLARTMITMYFENSVLAKTIISHLAESSKQAINLQDKYLALDNIAYLIELFHRQKPLPNRVSDGTLIGLGKRFFRLDDPFEWASIIYLADNQEILGTNLFTNWKGVGYGKSGYQKFISSTLSQDPGFMAQYGFLTGLRRIF